MTQIMNLPPLTTPAASDLYPVQQINGVTYGATPAQILAALSANPAILSAALLALAPTLPTQSQLVFGTPAIYINGQGLSYYPGT